MKIYIRGRVMRRLQPFTFMRGLICIGPIGVMWGEFPL